MTNKLSYIIVLSLILFSLISTGENIYRSDNAALRFKHLQVEHGLSSNVTSSILQDSKGFLWFGTDAGLNRFDGFQIKIFESGRNQDNSLSNGVIKCIFEDSKGKIWIGTERGLNYYDPQTDQFRYFLSQKENTNSLSNNTITSICEDNLNRIWVGTFNGLNQLMAFNKEGEPVFKRFNHNPQKKGSISNNRIFCLTIDKNGNLWVGTEGGGLNLLKAEEITKKELNFIHFTHLKSDPLSIANNIVYNIYQINDGSIYVGTDNGLSIFQEKGEEYHIQNYPNTEEQRRKFKEHKVYSLAQDKNNKIWIGTFGDGLILLNPEEKNYITYNNEPYNNQSLSRDFIFNVYISTEGIIWLATRETGIDRIDPNTQRFIHTKHNPNNLNSLSNNVIKSIAEGPDGKFWFGTYGGGLNVFDPKTNKYKSYVHSSSDLNSPSSNIIESITFDYLNRLWVGTSKGLNLFDPKKEKFTRFEHDSYNTNSLGNDNIWYILPSKDKKGLWIATYDGVDKYDWEKNKFYHFKNDPNEPTSLSFNFTRAILEDDNQVLWVSTWGGGLDKLDLKQKYDSGKAKFAHFRHIPEKKNSISSDLVNTTFLDSRNNLWVGTQDGLNLFRKGSDDFIRYTENDGLVDNVIKGILEDDKGQIWISTQKGMSKFNPSTKKFTNYFRKDGLQGDIFNLSSCLLNSKGQMMFGGNNGVSIFKPEEIIDRIDFPTVYINQIKINNQLIQSAQEFNGRIPVPNALDRQEIINLNHYENTINIEFSAIEYSSPEKIKFAYLLDGVDTKWNKADYQNRQVTYSGLKPGKYQFQVKSTNTNGEWGQNVARLTFSIAHPLWATNLAIFLYILILTGFVYYLGTIFRNRIQIKKELHREKEEHKKRIELNKFKLQFFTNVSHEIRTPLTLISLPLQKILNDNDKMNSKEKTSYLEAMDRNVQILMRLVNQLLDFRKVETKNIKLKIEQASLSKLLAYYTDNFKIIAEKKGINLSFEDTGIESIICIDNEKLESIISNLLSNAFKYTPDNKSIKVKLHNKGEIALPKSASNEFHNSDFICFSVQDTGIGIPHDKIDFIFDRFNQITSNSITEIGTGIGLAIAKYLTEAHKGFISVESTLGEGSAFFVWLPAKKDFYANDEIQEDSSVEFTPSNFIAKQSFTSSELDETVPEQNDSIGKIKEQTILIVEDHPEMRAYIKDSLRQKYNILEAENGKDGLEKALIDGPDLVITDVMMPVMDGMEFCKKLKKNINISHIPVVMLTAKNSLENELKGLDNGADQYLVKPFNIEHLLLVVRNLLESRKKMQLRFSGTSIPEPKEITVTSADEKFFQKTTEIIEKHIADSDFNVELLSQQTGLSTVHLYRKLKSITGMSTNEYIRSFKMKRAAQLLRQNKLRISEVAYSIGFNDPKYFRKCFKNEFGKSPSEYAKDEKLDEEITNS